METILYTDFLKISKEVAKDFLHTAVFVDEQAYFEKKEHVRKLLSPSREQTKITDADVPDDISDQPTHDLDAKKVIDTFAAEGIICSVIRPSKDEKLLSSPTVEAMKRADVLILDWDLHGDKGETALEIIQFLVSSDIDEDSRLRLIIIYSGEKDITNISDAVSDSLTSEFTDNNSFMSDGDFTYIKGHTRITIYAKEYANVIDEYSNRLLKIDDFPDRLAEEIAEMTNGLVSNVALEAMSVLRKKTHLILGMLGKEIDPAYLSHRALLPNPDDAMDHVIDILASEFHSVLENNDIGNKANINTIAVYLASKFKDNSKVKLFFGSNEEEEISIEDLIDIERKGFLYSDWLDKFIKSKSPGLDEDKLETKKRKYEKKIEKYLTKTFTIEGENSAISDYKLSSITSLKKRNGYLESPPILTQGTILKEIDSNDNFWLCILPKCDCVRIEDERTFLFLPLKKIKGEKRFHFVIEGEAGEFVKLKIDYSTYGLTGHNFKLEDSDDSLVRAFAENGSYYFRSVSKKFKWISELKINQAQRISNEFAAKLSRVGLDESEWQRRWAGYN